MATPSTAHSVLRWSLCLTGLGLLVWAVWPHEEKSASESAGVSHLSPQKRAKIASAQKLDRARPEAQKHALEDFIAGAPFVLVADGKAQRFNVSLSEVVVSEGPADKRFRKLEPQPDARHLLAAARKEGGEKTKLVLYPHGREGDPKARHFLGQRILVQTQDRQATLAQIKQLGLKLVDEPDYAPGSLIVETASGGPEAVFRALAALAESPGTVSAGPLLGRYHQKYAAPNDSLYAQQWWLKNTGLSGGKAGADMHVENVWTNYKGTNIRIGIVDDGLDLLHPDLSPNVDSGNNHYDWNDEPHDTNPQSHPSADTDLDDSHGTAVGGVAGARGNNNLGVSGVAPEATLVGFRLISSQDPDGTDDSEDAEAMSRGKDLIDIKNNSWGSGAPASIMIPAGPLMEAARQNAAATGRGGKGTVYVWAAGNGREYGEQGQKDGATNSMYVTTVAGIDNRGNLAGYSEGGSHLVVSAPTGGTASGTLKVYTTDLRGSNGYNRSGNGGEPASLDYTSSFSGTSSATPAVSGAVALMLQANSNLSWRDVKEILLRSSVVIPSALAPTAGGWVNRHGGDPSLPLIKHHEMFGGGLIDTQAAVAMAETWTSLAPSISSSRSFTTSRSIPDNDPAGITIPFDFSALASMRVEHAVLRLDLWHGFRGDLEVTLRSPSGTVSTLASKELRDLGDDYDNWDFSSVRHWGEAGTGIWTLTIKDLDASFTGLFRSATLTLHGTNDSPAPQITAHSPGPVLLRAGDPLSLAADGTGGGKLSFIWSRNGADISGIGNSKTLNIPALATSQGGNYKITIYNGAGSKASSDIPVGVVGPLQATASVKQDTTLGLSLYTTGPGLSHQWRRNGVNLTNGTSLGGGLISGATTATLNITDMQPDDEGGYSCLVGMNGTSDTIETNATAVSIITKPEVVTPTFGNGVRGTALSIQLAASGSPTGYVVTGLPPGVTLNKTTGILSGRPTKPGNYTLMISATNIAGTGPAIPYTWNVEEFPAAAIGTWQGITDRNSTLNLLLGGKFKVVVTSTGSYSGSLTYGVTTKSWTGYLNALPGGANPTTSFSISLGVGVTPMTGSFTLDLTNKTFTGNFFDGRPATFTECSGVLAAWTKVKPVNAVTVYNNALELPGTFVGDAAYPQGTSYAVLSLSTAGVVTWTGKLADGTAITGSSPLGSAGQTCYHALLYTNTGSAQGWANINLANMQVAGSVEWYKAAQKPTSTTRSYKAGIPKHALIVRGARYTKPATGVLVLGLPAPVSATSTTPNARLSFTGAPLSALEQLFQITSTNAVKMPTKAIDNPKAVRLTLAATTGLISGGFTLKDNDPLDITPPTITVISRAPTFNGVLVTHPDINKGVGFFNLAELADEVGEKNTTTKILSGKVELAAPVPTP
ncbi:MAG: S8 family serine peptidase [Verrucomicrobiota bacterium]